MGHNGEPNTRAPTLVRATFWGKDRVLRAPERVFLHKHLMEEVPSRQGFEEWKALGKGEIIRKAESKGKGSSKCVKLGK